jgi:nucleotide-binding universal stress UspA family protein
MKQIIVAIDFSSQTDPILQQAAFLAKALDAKLTIVHVSSDEIQAIAYEFTPFAGYSPDFISMPSDVQLARDLSAEEFKREHAQLLKISANLRKNGIDVQALLLAGNPAKQILKKANDLAADLIILGSHGHGLLRKALLGSVSEAVLHHATCNVLIIPPRPVQQN